MTATETRAAVDITQLRDMREKFFADRAYGLERLAAGIPMAGWLATIHDLRAQMAPVVSLLPDSAFFPRPTPAYGEEQWSAGQVIDHVCGAQRNVMFRFIDLISAGDGIEVAKPEAPSDPRPLSRAAALVELSQTNAALDELIARLSIAREPARTIDNHSFGTLGIRGILLFFAIHEYDHLGQLRALT